MYTFSSNIEDTRMAPCELQVDEMDDTNYLLMQEYNEDPISFEDMEGK
jgi:hypothetical protein